MLYLGTPDSVWTLPTPLMDVFHSLHGFTDSAARPIEGGNTDVTCLSFPLTICHRGWRKVKNVKFLVWQVYLNFNERGTQITLRNLRLRNTWIRQKATRSGDSINQGYSKQKKLSVTLESHNSWIEVQKVTAYLEVYRSTYFCHPHTPHPILWTTTPMKRPHWRTCGE